MASFVRQAYGALTGFTREKLLVLLTKTALSLLPPHPLLPCNNIFLRGSYRWSNEHKN